MNSVGRSMAPSRTTSGGNQYRAKNRGDDGAVAKNGPTDLSLGMASGYYPFLLKPELPGIHLTLRPLLNICLKNGHVSTMGGRLALTLSLIWTGRDFGRKVFGQMTTVEACP